MTIKLPLLATGFDIEINKKKLKISGLLITIPLNSLVFQDIYICL